MDIVGSKLRGPGPAREPDQREHDGIFAAHAQRVAGTPKKNRPGRAAYLQREMLPARNMSFGFTRKGPALLSGAYAPDYMLALTF